MGLENGIVAYIPDWESVVKLHNSGRYEIKVRGSGADAEYLIEACYWCRCRNIRNMVRDKIPHFKDGNETHLSANDIRSVIQGLKAFNRDNWQYDGGCNWGWDEPKRNSRKKMLKQDIRDLKRLLRLLKRYNLVISFYDSY